MAKEKTEETEDKKKEGVTIKIPKMNFWMITTIVLAIVLVGVLVRGQGITGKFVTPATMTAQDAANKAIDYINTYLLQGQGTANLTGVTEENGLYNLKFTIAGRSYDSYVTPDGNLLFPSVVDMSQTPETTTTVPATFEPKKTDKPVAQLYVMSFCPYGIQAETAMKPVVDLLSSKASIEPHFIVSVSGSTVNSLHGEYEANEDMRQACIWKNYGQATFWIYVDYLNKNCNKGNLDTCWKDAAKSAKVDAAKIENCFKTEGLTLMKAEDALSKQNGVSGSPTLIINGANYNGGRTAEAYKQAICSAFNKPPSECAKTLNETSSASASTGGCA